MPTTHKQSSEVEELHGKLAATRAQLSDLAMMGAVITRIQEIDAVLSVVMDMAVRLVEGEVGLMMIHENDELVTKASWGVGGDFVKSLHYQDDLDVATYCFDRKESLILSNLQIRSDEGIKIDSVLAMPIQTMDKCLGVIVIINKTDGGAYSDEDREVLSMLLNFVAVAIDNSRMMSERLSRQKIEQEMAVARQVQETILPQTDLQVGGAQIGAVFIPAREVGGDFYDILKINEGRFLVVLGDVSNKGVPAALVMSACSGIIKSVVTTEPSIPVADLAARVNDVLSEQIIKDRDMFVTLFLADFDIDSMKLCYCNGGHIPGLFWNHQGAAIEELSDGGPIVGQFSGIRFLQGERALSSGDRLLLFTDGLTEAEDVHGTMFGREQVEQVYSAQIGLPPRDFCLKVKDRIDRFTVGASEESHDDFTVLQVAID
ncbi:MAG: SpoIIE family protein phosphatase [Candidatus Zixiibacteriota bacterium]|nr:MAG: SpoIIE family protein phosphatase [candidate division Zixibacteria bacterium]